MYLFSAEYVDMYTGDGRAATIDIPPHTVADDKEAYMQAMGEALFKTRSNELLEALKFIAC